MGVHFKIVKDYSSVYGVLLCTPMISTSVLFYYNYSHLQFIPVQEGSNDGGYQMTPLALASADGYLDIVETLVEAKANVNYSSEVSYLNLTHVYMYWCVTDLNFNLNAYS